MKPHQILSEPILRGRLQELDVGSLLSALRLGRQYLTLEVYDAAGDCTGVVAIKAGRIISASVDGYTGTEAVRRLLESREAAEFRVLLQPTAAEDSVAEPLGTITSITQAISESEVRTLIARTRVLEGTLSERLSFEDVLRAIAFTRQHITLALSDAAGNPLGEVAVKANKVLSARAGDLLALLALRELQRAPAGTQFVLLAENQSVEQLHPLGTVAEVLTRIKDKDSNPDAQPSSSNGRGRALAQQTGQTIARRGRILEGSLEEFELSHVLKVLSTSRLPFELHVRDEAKGSVGMIEVKAGMVLAASTDKLSGVSAAQELLHARRGRFVAVRRSERTIELPALNALVSVNELLQPRAAKRTRPEHVAGDTHALRTSDAPSDTIPVMDGKLGELDVSSILFVAGASRQYTCVHIFDDQHQALGAIHLKSGQVLRAQAQDVTGVVAVRRLLHCPRDFSFLVERYPHAPEATSSIGSVASVLAHAATQPAPSVAARTGATSLLQLPAASSNGVAGTSNSWLGGAVLGAGFVLLGVIATALVLRPPAQTTTISPISAPPTGQEQPARAQAPIAQPQASEREETRVEPAVQITQADTSKAAAPADSPAPLTRAMIASLQAGLHQLGYDAGPVDGFVGPRTAAAIRTFQYAEHLTVDGTLSAPTRAVLLRRIGEP